MKNSVVKYGMVMGLFLAISAGMAMASAPKDVVGTWSYEAPYAPYEYSAGKLIFTEKDGKLEGVIKIGEYDIDMRNVKLDGETLAFGTYVEGEYISVKVTIKKDTLSGTASYSEGSIEVTGKKEK